MSLSNQHPLPETTKKWLLPSISAVAIIAYIFLVQYLWGWNTVLDVWKDVGFGFFFTAMGLIFVTHLVRGLRIYLYFKTPIMRFTPLFYLSQTHNLLNNLLPFRSGEVSFPLLMKSQFQVPLIKSGAGLLWLRVLDAHCLGMFAFAVILVKMQLLALALFTWLGLAFFVPVVIFVLQPKLEKYLQHLQKTQGVVATIANIFQKILHGLPQTWTMFWLTWIMTWLNWLIKILIMGFIVSMFLGLSSYSSNYLDGSWHDIVVGLAGAVAGEVTSILPVNAPAGVGTYAGGVYAGVKWLAPDAENVMFAGVNLHLLIMLSAFFGVVFAGVLNYFCSKK